MRLFRQRTLGNTCNTNDFQASLPRLARQLHNFRALAAPRNDDHRGVFGKRTESQQLVSVEQVNRMPMLMKHGANVQRRMPTAPDPRQVNMPCTANRFGCSLERTSRGPVRSRQALDGPPQLFRLPQYLFQKVCHEQLVMTVSQKSEGIYVPTLIDTRRGWFFPDFLSTTT